MKVIELMEEEVLALIAPRREILAPAEVLEVIGPADPDAVVHLGGGVYEARWADDGREACAGIARLANMLPRVVVVSGAPHRPEGNPRGLAVRFAVVPLPYEEVETIQ